MRRIAVLSSLAADDPETQARHAAFLQGLQERGWTTGRNVHYRWGAGDPDRFRKYAVEFAALGPDVILATGTPVTAALLQATRSVPLVFAQVVDPVANAPRETGTLDFGTSPCPGPFAMGNPRTPIQNDSGPPQEP